jgi:hypothetical protein
MNWKVSFISAFRLRHSFNYSDEFISFYALIGRIRECARATVPGMTIYDPFRDLAECNSGDPSQDIRAVSILPGHARQTANPTLNASRPPRDPGLRRDTSLRIVTPTLSSLRPYPGGLYLSRRTHHMTGLGRGGSGEC